MMVQGSGGTFFLLGVFSSEVKIEPTSDEAFDPSEEIFNRRHSLGSIHSEVAE